MHLCVRSLAPVTQAITSAGMMDEASADTFSRLVERYVEQRANPLDWERVERPDGLISPLATLATCPPVLQVRQEVLRKLAVVKLNGGLGTSMGLRGPKSALRVRSVRQQVCGKRCLCVAWAAQMCAHAAHASVMWWALLFFRVAHSWI